MRYLVLIVAATLATACAESRVYWRNDRDVYVERAAAEEACQTEWLMAPANRLERQHYRGIMIECMASYGWRAEVRETE